MAEFSAFVGGSHTSQSPVSDHEELINFYIETIESAGATAPASLYPTPGVQPFGTAAGIGARAIFWSNTIAQFTQTERGRAFCIFGNQFQELLHTGVTVPIGVVAVDAHPATISTNGAGGGQLFITSGGKGYCYTLGSGAFAEIPGLVATQGGMLSARFVAFNLTDSEIRISEQFDGLDWDTLQVQERSIGADPWRAMIITPYGQILLPGSQTGEIWYDTGAFPFPFAPDKSGLFAYGIAATFSIAILSDAAIWLAKTPEGGYQVMSAQGYRPLRVSTHAMEFEIAGYPRVDDAIGQCYTEQGHSFYLLTFPTAEVTWCFDASGPEGRRWHKRGTWISEAGTYQYWRPVFHAFAFGKHLMADRESNQIYEMSNAFPRDIESRVIRRVRRSPAASNENTLLRIRWFELLLEAGIGQAASPYGPPPLVMLRTSADSGRTWSDERQASAGALGAYSKRVYWSRLGQARQRVFEVSVSDPIINWRVTAAYLRAAPSTEQTG